MNEMFGQLVKPEKMLCNTRTKSYTRGQLREAAIKAVQENPGITCPELRRHLGVSARAINSIATRLVEDGLFGCVSKMTTITTVTRRKLKCFTWKETK